MQQVIPNHQLDGHCALPAWLVSVGVCCMCSAAAGQRTHRCVCTSFAVACLAAVVAASALFVTSSLHAWLGPSWENRLRSDAGSMH